MQQQNIVDEARVFADGEWEAILGDLDALVRIDSSDDRAAAKPGAPYGPGPRKALDEAKRIMAGYGFEMHDCEGYCGYFDVKGASDVQLLVIGHLDVVPAGVGWTRDPFRLTREGGALFGRGVIDDKGPLLMAAHALRFWRDRYEREGRAIPINVRVLFGCAEETGMEDADYYLKHHQAPDFLFTPDAEFPLCYGEKGHFQARLKSAPIVNGRIVSFEGGTAVNGVPGGAEAVVRASAGMLPEAQGIACEAIGGSSEEREAGGRKEDGEGMLARIRSFGVAGHAAMPEGTVNAVGVLAEYLLAHDLCFQEERQWLEFVRDIAGSTDGSSLGIACEDDDFGPLTCVASMATSQTQSGRRKDAQPQDTPFAAASYEPVCFYQAIDVRFPTATNTEQLRERVGECARALGATVEPIYEIDPLIVDPSSAQVQALGRAYEQVTGCEARLFTMGGGTYAHHFPVGVSFGALDEARFPSPEGAGGMHAADEGVAERALYDALLIYIVALGNLFDLKW